MDDWSADFVSFEKFFATGHTLAEGFLSSQPLLKAIPNIHDFLLQQIQNLDLSQYQEIAPQCWVHPNTIVDKSAVLIGPLLLGPGCEVRPGAYIRGNVLAGKNVVIGHCTEVKNSILFDEVQIPHFNYVGDSILGYRVHFGAGAITSNFRADHGQIKIKYGENARILPFNKMGAVVGDFTEGGCNAVLNPGTLLGKNCRVYPLASIRGTYPSETIVKQNGENSCVRHPKEEAQ